jgi:hypothetical protein
MLDFWVEVAANLFTEVDNLTWPLCWECASVGNLTLLLYSMKARLIIRDLLTILIVKDQGTD